MNKKNSCLGRAKRPVGWLGGTALPFPLPAHPGCARRAAVGRAGAAGQDPGDAELLRRVRDARLLHRVEELLAVYARGRQAHPKPNYSPHRPLDIVPAVNRCGLLEALRGRGAPIKTRRCAKRRSEGCQAPTFTHATLRKKLFPTTTPNRSDDRSDREIREPMDGHGDADANIEGAGACYIRTNSVLAACEQA